MSFLSAEELQIFMWTTDCICEIPPPELAKYWTLCSSSANGCGGGSADGLKWMMIIHADELDGVFTCGGISLWGLPVFCQAAISAVLSSFAWLCLGQLKPWWKQRWLVGFSEGMRALLRLPMAEPYWPVFTGFCNWVAVALSVFWMENNAERTAGKLRGAYFR